MSESLSPKIINEKILENFIEYQDLFVEFQSSFLSGIYKRYENMENGNLVLYFAKQAHQDILRQKDYDLNFNLSFEQFWENHGLYNPRKNTIINIANDTSLPKETARRKISQLIKQEVLGKKNKNIAWLPNEQYKKSYNLFAHEEINNLSQLLNLVCNKINLPISTKEAKKELKEKFSLYWFHYLNVQLKFLKIWSLRFKDLDLILISLQVIRIFTSSAKKNNLSHEKIFNDTSIIKNFEDVGISATSISEATSIPRATCIRKLEILIRLKMISRDKNSKRYYIIPTITGSNLISKKLTLEITKTFSEFYFICIRAINVTNLN